jgi:anti-anti-sigma regulatory factor
MTTPTLIPSTVLKQGLIGRSPGFPILAFLLPYARERSDGNCQMVKISIVDGTGKVRTVRLEGRLVDIWVTEVRKYCDTVLSERRKLILDLTNVSFADRPGIELLQQLQARNVRLVNCSPFLAGQIEGKGETGSPC